ncbi:MAG: hypothetical protein WCJ33_01650 [Pseudomonadota bacterium]
MKIKNLILLFALSLMLATSGGFAIAEEHQISEEKGDEKEKKKPPEKPRPDSAISIIMNLREVKNWQNFIESKKDGSEIEIWGASLKTIEDFKCWEVAVAERNGDEIKIFKRFCVMKSGLDIYIEKLPDENREIGYIKYEKWVSECKPTKNSPGNC